MKLVLALSALALVLSVNAEANTKKKPAKKNTYSRSYEEPSAPAELGMAGCGLGSMVIEDKGKWAQVGAAFLNGTGFQTFAISFGTSNCSEDGVSMAGREKEAFLEANYADVKHDVALGSGEYLSSLAKLYGCADASLFSEELKNSMGQSAQEALPKVEAAAQKLGCQG